MPPVGPRVPVTPSGARTWRHCPHSPAATVALGVSNPRGGGGQRMGSPECVFHECIQTKTPRAEGSKGQTQRRPKEAGGDSRRGGARSERHSEHSPEGCVSSHRTGPGGQGSRRPGSSRQGTRSWSAGTGACGGVGAATPRAHSEPSRASQELRSRRPRCSSLN